MLENSELGRVSTYRDIRKEIDMKKTFIAVALALVVAGAAFAQPWNQQNKSWGTAPGYGRGYNFQAPATAAAEKLSLEGSLELVDSRIAIKNEGKTYLVMIPSRLFGFVPGLVEGAKVKVEGYSHEIIGLKDTYGVRVESLTLNGKTYDLSGALTFGRGMMQTGPMGRMGGGTRGGNFGPSGSYGRGRW